MLHNFIYKPRPVRFLEVYDCQGWQIKIYSISSINNLVQEKKVVAAKQQIPTWLKAANLYELDTYKIATLILHEGKEGCFAIINWWIDATMIQHFVYLATNEKPNEFALYSHNGIITCVWELAVLWHERNAWMKHILLQSTQPNVEAYLLDVMNEDV